MDKKQVCIIHGAQSFSRYDDFLNYLRTTDVTAPIEDRPKRWKGSIRQELGDAYEVFLPSMPNSDNAQYEEWKIWFERHFQFFRDGVMLIGHSQGGYFLAKYLAENTMPVRVGALYLLAAPVGPADFGAEDGGDFAFDIKDFVRGVAHIAPIYILHSKDDPVVPFSHAEAYAQALPAATLMAFEDKGHFLGERFPELVASIKSL